MKESHILIDNVTIKFLYSFKGTCMFLKVMRQSNNLS